MIMDDPGPAIFEADPTDEYRLSFTVPDFVSRNGRRTLMTMRCFEEDKLRGVIVWLGEQQDRWPEWRTIAERAGGNALSAHIAAIMTEDSLRRFGSSDYLAESCLGATVTRGVGRTEVDISMTLATRSLPIITHAFKDVPARDAFLGYLTAKDRTIGCVELAEIALLAGRDELSRTLDSISHGRRSKTDRMFH